MAYKKRTLSRTCHRCGNSGTMTYEEADQTGATTVWIEATGSYVIRDDGKPHCQM